MSDTRTQILDTAEKFIRRGGYNDCSFREIATAVGIKSASVHHHFPAKQDLAAAVAMRYAENFLSTLGPPLPAGTTPQEEIARYCALFRSAFVGGGRACLCGILSNEAALLPERVRSEVAAFAQANVAWLEKLFGGEAGETSRRKARFIYSAMQGAMAASALNQVVGWLDDVAECIHRGVL